MRHSSTQSSICGHTYTVAMDLPYNYDQAQHFCDESGRGIPEPASWLPFCNPQKFVKTLWWLVRRVFWLRMEYKLWRKCDKGFRVFGLKSEVWCKILVTFASANNVEKSLDYQMLYPCFLERLYTEMFAIGFWDWLTFESSIWSLQIQNGDHQPGSFESRSTPRANDKLATELGVTENVCGVGSTVNSKVFSSVIWQYKMTVNHLWRYWKFAPLQFRFTHKRQTRTMERRR